MVNFADFRLVIHVSAILEFVTRIKGVIINFLNIGTDAVLATCNNIHEANSCSYTWEGANSFGVFFFYFSLFQ